MTICIDMLMISFILFARSTFAMECSCDTHLTTNGRDIPQQKIHRDIQRNTPKIFVHQDRMFRIGSECLSKPTCDTSKLNTTGRWGARMVATCVKVALDISGEFQGNDYETKGTYRDCLMVDKTAASFMDNRCMSHTLTDGYHSLDICLCADRDNCNEAINKQFSMFILISSVLLALIYD